jgi:hypothetical protein
VLVRKENKLSSNEAKKAIIAKPKNKEGNNKEQQSKK